MKELVGENPIRVCHIIGKVCRGGVEAVVFNYYRHIDHSKVQFDFVVHDDSPEEMPDDILALGCRVYRIPPYKHLRRYLAALREIFRDNGYRIVHSHMNALSVFTLYAAKKERVPVRIAHSHTTAGRGKGEALRNLMKYALRPFSRRYPTHYMACSQYAGKWLFGSGITDNPRYTLLRNAIDLDRFRFDEGARRKVRAEYGIPESAFVIGHIGRFMPQKNHGFLLDLFAEILQMKPQAHLLLIGDGPLMTEAKARAATLGIAENTIFVGSVPDTTRYYSAMDKFLLPSLYEGLPVTMLEAQANGLSCVMSDRITGEVAITPLVRILSLDAPLKDWAEAVLSARGAEPADNSARTQQAALLKEAGYDIRTEATRLAEKYMEFISAP